MTCVTKCEAERMLTNRIIECQRKIAKLKAMFNSRETSLYDVYSLSQTQNEFNRLSNMRTILNGYNDEVFYMDKSNGSVLDLMIKKVVPIVDYSIEYINGKWTPVFTEKDSEKLYNIFDSDGKMQQSNTILNNEVKEKAMRTAHTLNLECVTKICSVCGRPYAVRIDSATADNGVCRNCNK